VKMAAIEDGREQQQQQQQQQQRQQQQQQQQQQQHQHQHQQQEEQEEEEEEEEEVEEEEGEEEEEEYRQYYVNYKEDGWCGLNVVQLRNWVERFPDKVNEPDQHGETILYSVINRRKEDVEAVVAFAKWLINEKADVNARDPTGRTPLHDVCYLDIFIAL